MQTNREIRKQYWENGCNQLFLNPYKSIKTFTMEKMPLKKLPTSKGYQKQIMSSKIELNWKKEKFASKAAANQINFSVNSSMGEIE